MIFNILKIPRYLFLNYFTLESTIQHYINNKTVIVYMDENINVVNQVNYYVHLRDSLVQTSNI